MSVEEQHAAILRRAYGKDRLRRDELPSVRKPDGTFYSDAEILRRLPGWWGQETD